MKLVGLELCCSECSEGLCKYKVCIEETVSEEFEVEAETPERALEIAKEKYNSCEFVLEPGELVGKQMCVTSPEDKRTEWMEF